MTAAVCAACCGQGFEWQWQVYTLHALSQHTTTAHLQHTLHHHHCQLITTTSKTVGLEADHDEVSKLISDLEGKDINEVISEGLGRLSSVPSGGAVAAAGGAAAGAAAGGDAPAEEAKVEEEEEDEDMGFSLFD